MGLVTICSSGGDYAYNEAHSWPASTAIAYFTLAFITRNPVWTLLFAWVWEIVEYSLIFLHARLMARSRCCTRPGGGSADETGAQAPCSPGLWRVGHLG